MYLSYKMLFVLIFFTATLQIRNETDELSSEVEDFVLPHKSCLWQLTTLQDTVYFLGSVHVLSQNDYPLSPVINDAFARSDVVYFEVSIDSMEIPAVAQRVLRSGMYPAGETIKNHISEETFQLLSGEMLKLSLPVNMFLQYKPWLIAMTLTFTKLQHLGFGGNFGIDKHFFKKAKTNNKKTAGLESIQSQLHIFTSLSDKEQEKLLVETINSLHTIENDYRELVDAWKAGKLVALDSLLNKHLNEFPALKERLLDKRNENWVIKIEEGIKQHENAMIIVGAAHLIGDNSVIDLLREKGYKIKQL